MTKHELKSLETLAIIDGRRRRVHAAAESAKNEVLNGPRNLPDRLAVPAVSPIVELETSVPALQSQQPPEAASAPDTHTYALPSETAVPETNLPPATSTVEDLKDIRANLDDIYRGQWPGGV